LKNKLNIKKYLINFFITIILSSILIYFILPHNPNTQSFFNKISNFFSFDFGNYNQTNQKITLFQNQNTYSVGILFIYTLFRSFIALIIAYILAFILNNLILFKKNKFSSILREFLHWLSSIHILIISIIAFIIFGEHTPFYAGLFIILIASNAFYDLSEKQFNELKTLYNKDYIIAARAWGDNVWNHMKRNWIIISFDQLISVWIIFLSNTLIYEIMCQKRGIGYEIYKNIIDNIGFISEQNWVFEFDLFYIILFLLIIVTTLVNFFRKLILEYLIEIKR